MKIRRLLSVIASVVMAITSVSLTTFFTSADDSLNYNSKWDFISRSISVILDLDQPIPMGCYSCIDNYDDYKKLESRDVVSGYDKSFFDENTLIVNWLYSFTGDGGNYENPEIIKGADGALTFNYVYNMSFMILNWVAYDVNFIEFKKSDVKDIDFSKVKVNVTKTYANAEPFYGSNGELLGDPSAKPDESITIDMVYVDISSIIDDTTSNTEPINPSETSTTATPITTKVTKLAKVTKVKVKAQKKKLKVSWKKVSGACGYEVMYATNKKFTKGKKIVNVKKNKAVIKKLKAKKEYFVKVRAYKYETISGTKCIKKHVGKWSKIVKKKTK